MGDMKHVIIIGAGPAGLAAASELCEHGVSCTLLEASDMVGGLARTVNYKGYLFDIGGHRFFTKWPEIQSFWERALGGCFRERQRLSRIYYRKRFFHYPLRIWNALLGMGPVESARILIDYARASLRPTREETNVEQWMCNRFGRRLYEVFFKTYTEKVWGIPCSEIQAEWAAQRIKGLSLFAAVRNAILPTKKRNLKTLIDRFHYPDRGPGQMWESVARSVQQRGSRLLLNRQISRIHHADGKVTAVVAHNGGAEQSFTGTHFISSMPVRELIAALDPPAPAEVRHAATGLRYRDFLTVSLIVNRPHVLPDNWIYIHDPKVQVGRIQNFKNWSPNMVPDASKTCLGLEYFVFENDELWTMSDADLLALASRELVTLGLARADEIEDGTVVRVQKAYPMYDPGWTDRIRLIRSYLERELPNLQLVGRNGMHKYNNQDHSMMTAIGAARNILGANIDLWAINTEPDYQEEISAEREEEARRPAYAEPPRVKPAGKAAAATGDAR